ncbi:MAG: ParA family protein [Clostridia bacterium]|jgi:chromosome partitioning protein|nr:ParA family protein [Clostridia bacterium]
MARVITVAIEKGGSGKTTTVVNLAAVMAKHGKKVLCVDCDAQGNATVSLTQKRKSEFNDKGLFDLLSTLGITSGDMCINKTEIENIDIIPSNDMTSQILSYLAIMQHKYGEAAYVYLAKALAQFNDKYDYILIDTPPGRDEIVQNALYCADYALIPTQCDSYGIEGMEATFALIKTLEAQSGVEIPILGILLTVVENQTALTTLIRSNLQESDFGEDLLKSEIHKAQAYKESTFAMTPAVLMDRRGKPAKDYEALYMEIKKKMKKLEAE